MFDYILAIDLNRKTLLRMLAGLFAMVGGGESVRRRVRAAILRDLRAVEASARRLIAVAAVGLEVSARPKRAGPSAPIQTGSGERMPVFGLFDPRRYAGPSLPRRGAGEGPGVWALDGSGRYPRKPVASPDDPVSALRMLRRLRAVRHALETVPAQARRLARITAALERPMRVMRPGRPPGHVARGKRAVDVVLAECHALALMALVKAPP